MECAMAPKYYFVIYIFLGASQAWANFIPEVDSRGKNPMWVYISYVKWDIIDFYLKKPHLGIQVMA